MTVTNANVIPMRSGVEHAPRVIAVTSGKGGVGKTFFASNLGLSFARAGRRVLMVDADLALANLDLMLGVRATHTLSDLLSGAATLEDILVKGPQGIHLLPACSGDETLANLAHQQRLGLFSAIDTLEDRFDTVIVDTGAGIGSNAVGFAAAAQQVVVVVTPDPASIADGYAMMKVLSRTGVTQFQLLVNMVSCAKEADGVVARVLDLVGQFLDVSVIPLGCIFRDETVMRSVRTCRPLMVEFPRASVAATIRGIGKRLIEDTCQTSANGSMLFWKKLSGIAQPC